MAITKSRPLTADLRYRAINREFSPNDPIDIRKLERELGTSTIPIREALIELAKEDLVDFIPGRGFFGRAVGVAELVASFELFEYFLVDAANFFCPSHPARQPQIGV